MKPSRSVFKAYDLRGTVPATVNEELAEALGRAFGTLVRREGEGRVAVGRDGRLSSPARRRPVPRRGRDADGLVRDPHRLPRRRPGHAAHHGRRWRGTPDGSGGVRLRSPPPYGAAFAG
jgi:hypothetical protein